MRLADRNAVVTGGGRGLGLGIAQRLAKEGARVAVLDVDGATARAALADGDPRHLGLACDISDSKAVDDAFAKIVAAFGGVDILVNNAGIGYVPGDGTEQAYAGNAERDAQAMRGELPTALRDQTIHMSDAGWLKVQAVNVNGSFFCARAAIRDMARRGAQGAIVNMSSTGAVSGDTGVHYVTSKAALVGLTRGLAHEVAPRGIRVNAVLPGFVKTPLNEQLPDHQKRGGLLKTPLGRMGEIDEIAAAVAFLASDEASYITGEAMAINGGYCFW